MTAAGTIAPFLIISLIISPLAEPIIREIHRKPVPHEADRLRKDAQTQNPSECERNLFLLVSLAEPLPDPGPPSTKMTLGFCCIFPVVVLHECHVANFEFMTS